MRKTIKNHKDFDFENAASIATSFFIIKSRKTKFPDDARFGIVASKKTLKLATQRNRAKRLLRTWIRSCKNSMSDDLDYLFIIRSSILNATLANGVTVMKNAIDKISVIK